MYLMPVSNFCAAIKICTSANIQYNVNICDQLMLQQDLLTSQLLMSLIP